MALTLLSKDIVNQPDVLRAMHQAFIHVEEAPFPETGLSATEFQPHYKRFRLKGQGVPDSDKYVTIDFRLNNGAGMKVSGWRFADQTTGL